VGLTALCRHCRSEDLYAVEAAGAPSVVNLRCRGCGHRSFVHGFDFENRESGREPGEE